MLAESPFAYIQRWRQIVHVPSNELILTLFVGSIDGLADGLLEPVFLRRSSTTLLAMFLNALMNAFLTVFIAAYQVYQPLLLSLLKRIGSFFGRSFRYNWTPSHHCLLSRNFTQSGLVAKQAFIQRLNFCLDL